MVSPSSAPPRGHQSVCETEGSEGFFLRQRREHRRRWPKPIRRQVKGVAAVPCESWEASRERLNPLAGNEGMDTDWRVVEEARVDGVCTPWHGIYGAAIGEHGREPMRRGGQAHRRHGVGQFALTEGMVDHRIGVSALSRALPHVHDTQAH
jgi:hypothetical protein